MSIEEKYGLTDGLTEGLTEGRSSFEKVEDDKNNYTMGAQEYYTQAMKNIRSNRHVQVDEDVLQKIEQTESRIKEKYGVDSIHYRKFVEKLQIYENLKDNVEILKKGNKKRAVIITVLIGVSVMAICAGIFLAMNTDTYYINQGQYNRIYKRNIFGTVECFKNVSCNALIKEGDELFYIKKEDSKIYSTSVKNEEDESLICDDSAEAFKIVDDYIYYINNSDGKKLYRIDTFGNDKEMLSEEACLSISVDKKNIEFVNESDPSSPKTYDTKTGEVKDSLIG